MKKRYSKRILCLMLSAFLLFMSVSPTSAVAADEVNMQDDAQVETVQQPAQDDPTQESDVDVSENLSGGGITGGVTG